MKVRSRRAAEAEGEARTPLPEHARGERACSDKGTDSAGRLPATLRARSSSCVHRLQPFPFPAASCPPGSKTTSPTTLPRPGRVEAVDWATANSNSAAPPSPRAPTLAHRVTGRERSTCLVPPFFRVFGHPDLTRQLDHLQEEQLYSKPLAPAAPNTQHESREAIEAIQLLEPGFTE